jgi:hypothetical protein
VEVAVLVLFLGVVFSGHGTQGQPQTTAGAKALGTAASVTSAIGRMVVNPLPVSAGPQDIRPLPTPPPKPFQKSRAKVIKRAEGAILMRGDVQLTIDEGAVVFADEAELRHDSEGGYQILLSGDVRLSLNTRPSIKAQYARHIANNGMAYRSDVRFRVGSLGAWMLADECDYFPANGEFTLRGNVRIERHYQPLKWTPRDSDSSDQVQQASAAQALNPASFDEFMKLSIKQRHEQFSRLGADGKAFMVRTHAERWLAANRPRLGSSEVAVYQEAIAFVTPQIYEGPMDPHVMKQEQDVKASMRCRVNPADVAAAFDVLGRPALGATEARWSYMDRAKCWVGWFAESIVDYIPTIPR